MCVFVERGVEEAMCVCGVGIGEAMCVCLWRGRRREGHVHVCVERGRLYACVERGEKGGRKRG